MKYVFAGDSWALKEFTEDNYNLANRKLLPGETCLADHWDMPYIHCVNPGHGNLAILEKFINLDIDNTVPVIWVYTEPGRDYGLITGDDEFNWLKREDFFELRAELDAIILKRIRESIPNPIALIGGLSDFNVGLATTLGFHILHPSWQHWIATTLNRTQYFDFGWGTGDIGWRHDYDNVNPSKTALFNFDPRIKEWCMWADLGYFCHEHPSVRANQEFAKYLKEQVYTWLGEHNVKK